MIFTAITTLKTEQEAKQIAQNLIREKLCACAQISSVITSIYEWEGRLEETTEYRLTLKTHSSTITDLEIRLHELHPYETPQWIVIKSESSSENYAKWVESTISK